MCFEYVLFLWINIVNNLKLVAGFTYISFSLRLTRNRINEEKIRIRYTGNSTQLQLDAEGKH